MHLRTLNKEIRNAPLLMPDLLFVWEDLWWRKRMREGDNRMKSRNETRRIGLCLCIQMCFLHSFPLSFSLWCGCILSFLLWRGDLHYSYWLSPLPLECSLQLSDPLFTLSIHFSLQHFASPCSPTLSSAKCSDVVHVTPLWWQMYATSPCIFQAIEPPWHSAKTFCVNINEG